MRIFNDLTIGQYYPGKSWVHRLDPRAKMLFTAVAMVSLFSVASWLAIGLWGVVAVLMLYSSGVPASLMLRNLRPFAWLFVLTFVLQLVFAPETGGVSIRIGPWIVSEAAALKAAFYCIRLAFFILFSAFLTLTTSPIELTDALEKLLKPLQKLRIPVHEIAMMASLAMRFIPTVLQEAQRIQKAQIARGARFDGNLYARTKALLPLILPLLLSTLQRAEDLAVAMEARCYDARACRTSYTVLAWRLHESLFLFVAVAIAVLIVLY